MSKRDITDWLDDYEQGCITKRDLLIGMLEAAEGADDFDTFAARVPVEFLIEFANFVQRYTEGEPLVQVGAGDATTPSAGTIVPLYEALCKRLQTQNSD